MINAARLLYRLQPVQKSRAPVRPVFVINVGLKISKRINPRLWIFRLNHPGIYSERVSKMRVKISFHIKAEAVPQMARGAEAGAGSAGGELFRMQFYEFEKDLKPTGFKFYMNRLTKIMAGFSRAMDVLNNFRRMEG